MTVLRASVILLSLFTSSALGAEPAVKLVSPKAGDPPVVEITGIDKSHLKALAGAKLTPEEWAKVARFVVDSGSPEEIASRPSVAGAWAVAGDVLRFEPEYPLAPGVKYRVFCDLSATPRAKIKADAFTLSVFIPKPPPGPRVAVTAVYPSANRLPENTLRFYIHFSGPVTRGDVYSYVKLIRDDETEVTGAFLELGEELWSTDGLRLTLLFDPGRVKRGLAPREVFGPILEEGRRYTFVIDPKWEDTEGRPLLNKITRTFDVGPPDDSPVWPDQWKLVAPRPGGNSPLLIRLAKPHDHALLGRMMWVTDKSGKRIAGTFSVGGGDRVVSFTPKSPWTRGDYKLVIDARLEDVCGNRVGEPFEVDEFKPITVKPIEKTVERPFTVK
ncbi:MAG: hypothetical protein L0241_13410 [Planctomycetia bacterium]|nr:hypothetical protein [Planctomycetia bacterium]